MHISDTIVEHHTEVHAFHPSFAKLNELVLRIFADFSQQQTPSALTGKELFIQFAYFCLLCHSAHRELCIIYPFIVPKQLFIEDRSFKYMHSLKIVSSFYALVVVSGKFFDFLLICLYVLL